MDFTKYQLETKKTAIYPKEFGLFYTVMGLTGEAGELANKTKKILRDKIVITPDTTVADIQHQIKKILEADPKLKEDLKSELGDNLWYISEIANTLEASLNVIAEENIEKLNSRKQRNVLSGSGDTR